MSQQLHRPGLLQSSSRQASHRQQAPRVRPSAQRAPVQQQQWQLRHHQQQHQHLHSPGGSSRQQVACEALFGFLRGGGDKGSGGNSKLAEKPLYAKQDMFDLGGLQVGEGGALQLVVKPRAVGQRVGVTRRSRVFVCACLAAWLCVCVCVQVSPMGLGTWAWGNK